MIRKIIFLSLAVFSIFAFSACEEEIDEQAADELIRLQAYMRVNYPNYNLTSSGLYWDIIEEGTGETPKQGDYLLFNFTGYSLDNDAFETSSKSIAQLHDVYSSATHYVPKFAMYKSTTSRMLKGLDEGFSMIKAGTKARFIMPSSLAYGASVYNNLPSYSSVIFDIDFQRIITDPDAYEAEVITEYLAANYPDLNPSEVIAFMNGDGEGVYILEEALDEVEDDTEEGEEGDDDEEVDHHLEIIDKDVVTLYYAGRFLDNWLFDTNMKEVAEANGTFSSSKTYEALKVTVGGTGYIAGFSIALKRLKTNSTSKVLIMSGSAYGENGSGSTIQPYTPLVFDLKVLTKTASSSK
ncbi:MAG: FKBP-type peptidyl-prolyl cis-trans isomerase [Tenuifilaceae bacterium]|jgi:FKBP-type peptidyl-prolyl cis-trans isomerase|nr:FKBP-type peptidyl-prolyl cis-trans isomerase [Tenuifilaceae bacterium]